MTKLQQLREAIIKEIPEIIKLKFGCKVRIYTKGEEIAATESNPDSIHNIDEIVVVDDYMERSKVFVWDSDEFRFDEVKKGITGEDEDDEAFFFEIIGRKITLADVLRVLNKKIDIRLGVILLKGGQFYFSRGRGFKSEDCNCHWQFDKPFSLQSEKTIDFLSKIILKDE